MSRPVYLVLAYCVLVVFSLSADEPKKPQWQRLLSGDDAKTAAKLQQQIDDLCAKDDYAGAIKSGEELLALRTKEQGKDHYETANVKQQLSANRKVAELSTEKRKGWRIAMTDSWGNAAPFEASGQYVETLRKQETFLTWCREVLGEEHAYTATSYNNMAVVLAFQGKTAEAQPLFKKVLEIRRKVLGEDHPDTATSYHNAATNLNAQGKYAEAQPLYQKALDIRSIVLGEDHPETAGSINNVAFNLNAQGKYAEAQPLYQKALELYRKVLGEEHSNTAMGYNNLAMNLNAQGKYAEAQPLFQKALEIQRKLLGEEHYGTARSYSNLAYNLNFQGKFAEALLFNQKALEIRRKLFGEDHLETATSYSLLTYTLVSQGKYAEALPFSQQALETRRKVLGEDHPLTAESYQTAAVNLNAQGKYSQAQLLFQRCLEIRRKVLGEDHPDTARSYNTVAYNLDAQGKYAEALPFVQRGLEIRRKVLGEDHPDTAQSYDSVAVNLNAQGKFAEAQLLSQKALDIHRKVLGEDHPDTARSYNNVAVNLYLQGKNAEAETLLKRGANSHESSRLAGASGLERASFRDFNPRLLLAVIQQSGDPNAAWHSVELSLARGLLDQQASRKDPVLTPAELAAQTRERTRVAALQPRILALIAKGQRTDAETEALESLLKERRETEERLASIEVAASQREVASPDAIRKALFSDVALVFWVDVSGRNGVFEEQWACVVRSVGDPKWERLPGMGLAGKWSADDADLPWKLRDALSRSASQNEIESLVKQLHAQRIAPILKHLVGVKTVYVVPFSSMAGVPVELLLPNVTVSYVPSGTFLARANGRAPLMGQRMLALGDPVFTRPDQKPAKVKPLPPGGLLITQVVPNSVAAKARLQVGDVLLQYGEVEVKDLDRLKTAIIANEKAASVPVTVWRDTANKPFIRDVAPGTLGVVLDRDPAPIAVANRRKTDAMLQALRGNGWGDLPGTRVETNRLRQLLGDDCVVLTDSAASEQSLEALRKSGELAKFRYLHFATHGESNSVLAFESNLILAQDNLPKDLLPKVGEPYINGQLSAGEVLEFWKLNSELVTLSACETALGKEGGCDGLLGFAQAFLTAGSRSVCLSLWKVDDTATALLMDRFYQNLLGKREGLAKPLGKAAALDEAKRWLRNLSGEEALDLTAKISKGVARGTRSKDEELKLAVPSTDPKLPAAKDSKPFAHPKYWAPFILIGDPN